MNVSKLNKPIFYSFLINVTVLVANIYLLSNDLTSSPAFNLVLAGFLNRRLIDSNKEMTSRDKAIILSLTLVNILSVVIYMPMILSSR